VLLIKLVWTRFEYELCPLCAICDSVTLLAQDYQRIVVPVFLEGSGEVFCQALRDHPCLLRRQPVAQV
jgi:hypothetical protein